MAGTIAHYLLQPDMKHSMDYLAEVFLNYKPVSIEELIGKKGKNQKSIIVNGVSNHVHVFVGLKPSMSVSNLVRDIKNNSSNFINNSKFLQNKFSWQEGYGAFSYNHLQLNDIYQYILNQEEHHRKKTFREEYYALLKEFDVDFEDKYLFERDD